MNICLLTSWDMSPRSGSGVVESIRVMQKLFRQMGHQAVIRNSARLPDDYAKMMEARRKFNEELVAKEFGEYDLVLGFDFDGYLLEGLKCPLWCRNGGIAGDIVRFETGRTREILTRAAEWEARLANRSQLVLCPSTYAADYIQASYGADAGRIQILPNAMDLIEWDRLLAAAVRNESSVVRILTVCKLYPRKRVDVLLAALSQLKEMDWRLDIVGGGLEETRLRERAQDLGLSQRVKFHGDVDNRGRVAAFYRNCDIFCLPSVHETFGNVLLEAMATSLPIIAAPVTAVPEVLSDDCALWCQADSSDGTALALRILMSDEMLRSKLGHAGRTRVEELFTFRRAKETLARMLPQ